MLFFFWEGGGGGNLTHEIRLVLFKFYRLGLKLVDWTKIPLAFIGDFVVGLIFFELANLFSSTLD